MEYISDIVSQLGLNLDHEINEDQAAILQALVTGKHAFGIYPTGFGKSDCFGLFPAIMDKLHPETGHIALIISPLRSLMMDQVRRWEKVGVKSAAILAHKDMDTETITGLKSGQFSLVFASPEAALASEWYKTFIKQGKSGQICLLALDEVHCMIRWGNFRSEYGQVSQLRSPLSAVPVLCLTATATPKMVYQILEALHLNKKDVLVKGKLPDRPNIHITKKRVKSAIHEEHLGWVADLLREKGRECPKIIIYTRTVDECAELWGYLCAAIQGKLYHLEGCEARSVKNRLVDMFHGDTAKVDQERIVESFTSDGPLRCVTATSAFGMGVQVDDIRHVLHWGPAKDLLDYWQQVGRAGRDGLPSKAVMYIYPRSVNKKYIESDMQAFATCESTCLRKLVLKQLLVPGMDKAGMAFRHTSCCSICDMETREHVAETTEVTHL